MHRTVTGSWDALGSFWALVLLYKELDKMSEGHRDFFMLIFHLLKVKGGRNIGRKERRSWKKNNCTEKWMWGKKIRFTCSAGHCERKTVPTRPVAAGVYPHLKAEPSHPVQGAAAVLCLCPGRDWQISMIGRSCPIVQTVYHALISCLKMPHPFKAYTWVPLVCPRGNSHQPNLRTFSPPQTLYPLAVPSQTPHFLQP